MNVTDLVFIDSAGFHCADFPTFLSWLQGQYQAIYGADVNLDPDTQDGQWTSVVAQALYDTAQIGGSVFNSFSPVTAQGVGLSRVVKINGLRRGIPTNSQVDVLITGQAGTTISKGVVQDTLQQLWNLPASVTIPSGGTIIVTAVAQVQGDLTADASTVTTIFTPTLGWQSVTNSAAATPGAPVETDSELRIRQSNSTADPSLTVFDGTVGGVSNLTGVTQVAGYENDSDSTDGNGLPPHSICVVVTGGDDVAICNEIMLHKTPGTNTFGDTSEIVYDAHGMPLSISFQRSVPATIHVAITGTKNQGWSDDYLAEIKAAVAAFISGGGIGQSVIFSKIFTPAYLTGTPASTTFVISTLTIAKNGGSPGTVNLDLDFDEQPICDPLTNVSVSIT